MKFPLAAALIAASVATLAIAAPVKPKPEGMPDSVPLPTTGAVSGGAHTIAGGPGGAASDGSAIPDARSVASDASVGEARRAYRAACSRTENAAFCECVTAGVAQALPPNELRLAASTVRERLSAQGDAAVTALDEPPPADADPMWRIEHAEGYYADACSALR